MQRPVPKSRLEVPGRGIVQDAALVFLLALGMRLALIGAAPHADEGHYAAASYFQFLGYTAWGPGAVSVIPTPGTLQFYSLLFSWLYFVQAEPLLLFRLADALFAALSGGVIVLYLRQVTGRRWAALGAAVVVVLAFNHPEFIEGGARNPIAAATFCFFLAVYLVERAGARSAVPAGIVMGLAVLAREPFVIFAGVWMLHAWHRHGWRVAVRLGGSMAACIAVGFVLVAALKGGVGGAEAIVHAYANTAVKDPGFNLTFELRLERVQRFAGELAVKLGFCIPVLVLGLLSPVFASGGQGRKGPAPYLFALGLVLAAAVEVLIKRPYSYHMAQFFLGGSILAALGLARLGEFGSRLRRSGLSVTAAVSGLLLIVHGALLADYVRTLRYAVAWSVHFAPVTVLGDWSSPVVEEAHYLKMAALVRRHSKPDETILTTTVNVYPLTRRLPVSRELAHIGAPLGVVALSQVRRAQPRLFVLEFGSTHAAGQEARIALSRQLGDQFTLVYKVGPGLSPYRQFSAQVFVRESDAAAKP